MIDAGERIDATQPSLSYAARYAVIAAVLAFKYGKCAGLRHAPSMARRDGIVCQEYADGVVRIF